MTLVVGGAGGTASPLTGGLPVGVTTEDNTTKEHNMASHAEDTLTAALRERDEAIKERDEARAEVARLTANATAREGGRRRESDLLRKAQRERDEARALLARLYEVAVSASNNYPKTETLRQQAAHHALIDVLYSDEYEEVSGAR